MFICILIPYRDESLFLYETTVTAAVGTVLADLVAIHNGRRKILRLAAEVREYIMYTS
jgi:hypothetical protein